MTANVSVELYHWDDALRTQVGLPGFYWMREQGVHALITDGNAMTDYVGQNAAVFQLPTCGSITTDPDINNIVDYPYVSLMRATDDAAASAGSVPAFISRRRYAGSCKFHSKLN